MDSEKIKVQDTPALGITVQHQISDKTNLVFQSFVPFDCSDNELNAGLDKIARAMQRQQAITTIPAQIALIETLERGNKRAAEDIMRLDAEADFSRQSEPANDRRTPRPRSTAQINEDNKRAADRSNAATTLERRRQDLADAIKELERLKTLAGD